MDQQTALLRLKRLQAEMKALLADLAAPSTPPAPVDAWTAALKARAGAPVDHTAALDSARAFRLQLGRAR
jgi:hypothetical protein